MAQQRVKFISYLTKREIELQDLKDQSYEAIVLPSGAEILSVNIEVLESAKTGSTLNIGLKDDEKFFSELLDITQKTNYASSKITATKKQEIITLKLNQETSGVIVLRVLYFLPSEIMAEF